MANHLYSYQICKDNYHATSMTVLRCGGHAVGQSQLSQIPKVSKKAYSMQDIIEEDSVVLKISYSIRADTHDIIRVHFVTIAFSLLRSEPSNKYSIDLLL